MRRMSGVDVQPIDSWQVLGREFSPIDYQDLMFITIIKDIAWRIISTSPFGSIRPRICHSNIYRLNGKTKRSNFDFSTVVFGRSEVAEYFSRLIYIDNPELEFLGKRAISDIPLFAEKATEDLVIVEMNWAFSSYLLGNRFFLLPQINFTLDITNSLEEITNRMTTSKIRRIKRLLGEGYSCEITKDPAKLQSFYYEMYLPHMLAKHGKAAKPVSFAECKRLFLKGDLLLVKKDQECVAGIILVPNGKELYQPLIAVKDLDKQFTLGSYAAAYYTIVFGKQKGYVKVDFGDAPPFLQDGLFQFKREWGMRIRPAVGEDTPVFGAIFPNMSEAAKDFLSANPFVILDGTSLKGVAFRDTLENDIYDFLNVPGISSFHIISSNLSNLSNGSKKRANHVLEDTDVQNNVPLSHLIDLCHQKNWVVHDLSLTN
jgi:hypothetical protein